MLSLSSTSPRRTSHRVLDYIVEHSASLYVQVMFNVASLLQSSSFAHSSSSTLSVFDKCFDVSVRDFFFPRKGPDCSLVLLGFGRTPLFCSQFVRSSCFANRRSCMRSRISCRRHTADCFSTYRHDCTRDRTTRDRIGILGADSAVGGNGREEGRKNERKHVRLGF